MKPVILCVNIEPATIERLAAEARSVLGEDLRIEFCRDTASARECFHARLAFGNDVPIVVADTALPAGEREALFDEIRRASPWTGTISLPGAATGRPQANTVAAGREFNTALRRSVAGLTVGQGHEPPAESAGAGHNNDRPIIETLLEIVGAKAKELDDRKGELEEAFKELNAATIQRLLIEREAERMSRRLSALQNNLKNNLFIRSVLHSLINMLQVQLAIDKEENNVIEEVEEVLAAAPRGTGLGVPALAALTEHLLPQIRSLRSKTDDNIHKTMLGYARAVQRSLMGEPGFVSDRPTNLVHVVERVRLKYREILAGEKDGRPVRFALEPASGEVKIWMYDFALINIVENLLTNSIRKVLAADRPERWIKLEVSEDKRPNETYTLLTWSDNGGGVAEARKRSIFEGDSDKTEDGDHGVGLSDVKSTIESAGGFIREQGVPGEGAIFVLGFPKPGTREGEYMYGANEDE